MNHCLRFNHCSECIKHSMHIIFLKKSLETSTEANSVQNNACLAIHSRAFRWGKIGLGVDLRQMLIFLYFFFFEGLYF